MGKIIDIEGLDGSGKGTQSDLLYKKMKVNYKGMLKYISFPNYKSESSSTLKMYLNGEFGKSPFDVNAYAASSFFAVDRFADYKKNWQEDYIKGKTIIANRYTASNALYQMPKLKKDDWEDYLTWVYDYEYNKLELPKPNIIIYLDVPIEISQELMEKRYLGDNSCKDLHESNMGFLKLCRDAGLYAAKRDGWTVINCVNEGKIRDINNINKDIIECIDKSLR